MKKDTVSFDVDDPRSYSDQNSLDRDTNEVKRVLDNFLSSDPGARMSAAINNLPKDYKGAILALTLLAIGDIGGEVFGDNDETTMGTRQWIDDDPDYLNRP